MGSVAISAQATSWLAVLGRSLTEGAGLCRAATMPPLSHGHGVAADGGGDDHGVGLVHVPDLDALMLALAGEHPAPPEGHKMLQVCTQYFSPGPHQYRRGFSPGAITSICDVVDQSLQSRR